MRRFLPKTRLRRHDCADTTAITTMMTVLITILRYLVAIGGMALVAYIAWKLVNKQEANDPEFKKKLDEDDERASKGRFGPPM